MDNQCKEMFHQLGNSPIGKGLIKYLNERMAEVFDVSNITGEVKLEGAKFAKTFIKQEIIDKINAFSGNQKVGEGGSELEGEEFR